MNIIKDYPCNTANYSKRTGKIKYIVVHYVGATGGAKDNAMYYNRESVGASAHYYVGHASEHGAIYQSVAPEYRAWHCGSETGTYFHKECRNDNSIGVELCCKYINTKGWYFEDETVNAAVELVRYLMAQYGISIENVLRHYDVTHKNCPAPFVEDETAWTDFKKRLENDESMTNEERTKFNALVDALANLTARVDTIANPKTYAYVDAYMPDWAKETVTKLYNKGYLKGDEEGKLNLDENMLRMLVILDRAGVFG